MVRKTLAGIPLYPDLFLYPSGMAAVCCAIAIPEFFDVMCVGFGSHEAKAETEEDLISHKGKDKNASMYRAMRFLHSSAKSPSSRYCRSAGAVDGITRGKKQETGVDAGQGREQEKGNKFGIVVNFHAT
ncbi:hypothetical protein KCP75_24080 [Salmonella enterica subsp. enterica]|nr:hypothetical protein KCP75_24080 [Salmonella enterica subsp. enterica]